MKDKSSFNPSLTTCCSNIKDCSDTSPPIIQSISTLSSWVVFESVHLDSKSSGYAKGRINSKSSLISSLTLPVILNSPLDKHVVSETEVGSNTTGTLFLFSSRE